MTALASLLAAYAAAVDRKDVDAFKALYDADVVVFDTWGTWVHRGREAWGEMARGWFESLGDERVEVTCADVTETAAGDGLGCLYAFVTYTAVSSTGQKLRAMTNRLTWVARPVDGSWRVIHEHTSAPADFESAKLILTRT